MTLKLITAPATEPVTLAEAKAQCRVDVSDEDSLITALIVAARQEAEHILGRALITQTWERVVDAFPDVELELGMPPVQSVTSITYVDLAGVTQTLAAPSYVLDNTLEPGFVLPAAGYTWPETFDTVNAVRVRFTSGYGASASNVPQSIRTWVLMRVATLYKFREEAAVGVSVTEMPARHLDRLLDPYRVWTA